ncbi:MAG: HipA domain-containing protein [Bacteroidales bacterium]|nr:HipA domain-containing protein [Bacteroidales bacterium]MBR3413234.1 HipA domain-containing protein [Bacteroidales bacterium]
MNNSPLFDSRRVSMMLDFDLDTQHHTEEMTLAMQRISVSGVQEKFPAVVDGGRIRLAAEGERSTHILKPAPWDATLGERWQIPANEHLTMQIASEVYNIPVAAHGLCTTPSGHPVYITRRFDISPDGSKYPMEDMATLIGRSEAIGGTAFKYNGSYMEIAQCIRRYIPAWMVEMERFFELVVFNYIYANGDAHLKNFSIILIDGGYRLTPAYDLMNTSLHVRDEDFALDGGLSPDMPRSNIYQHTGHPCRQDFEWFGHEIGLVSTRIQRILDKYMSVPDKTRKLVTQSHLTEKLQRSYLRIVNERSQRFVRTC